MTETKQTVSRRSFVGGVAAFGFACSALGQLCGCAGGAPKKDEKDGKEKASGSGLQKVVIVYPQSAKSFDPVNRWDGWFTERNGLTETLATFDKQMNIIPLLATEWKNIDPLKWEFTLRKGVKFQSGKEVDAQAVKKSIERALAKNPQGPKKSKLAGVEAQGSDKIIFTTSKPVATFPGEIAEPLFGIVDVDVVDKDPSHSGTGPYMGDNVSSLETFTLKANENYWQGKPAIPTVEVRHVADASARAMGIKSGEAHVAANLAAIDLKTMKADKKYTVLQTESVRTVLMFCNNKGELLKDPALRKAMSLATDRKTLCENLLGGNLAANATPFPNYLSYTKAVSSKADKFDVEKAKKILKDAGYADSDGDGILEKDGKKLEFTLAYYSSRAELVSLAPALQDAYKKIGIAIKPQLFENVDTIFYSGNFDLILYNTTALGNGDPTYFMNLYLNSKGSENAGKYANPKVDEIIERMNSEFDQKRRFAMAQDVLSMLIQDCPNVYIGNPVINVVEAKGVQGYKLLPVDYQGVTHELR